MTNVSIAFGGQFIIWYVFNAYSIFLFCFVFMSL